MRWRWLFWLILLLTTGCRLGTAEPTPVDLAEPTTVAAPTATATWTPTPVPEPLVLVLAPETADPDLAARVVAWAEEWATTQGWRWQQTSAWMAPPAGLRGVLVLPPADPLPVAREVPEVPVITFAALPEEAPGNLYAVDLSPFTPEVLAFAAGYLAALVTPDYRVGAVSGESQAAQARLQAFADGVAYYCGLCNPAFPPFVRYPVWVTVPDDAAVESWWLGAQALATQYAVERVYFTDSAVAARLASGGEARPGPVWAGGSWPGNAAPLSLMVRPAVEEALSQVGAALFTGAGTPPRVTVPAWEIRGEGLSLGKQRWALEVLNALKAGRIQP